MHQLSRISLLVPVLTALQKRVTSGLSMHTLVPWRDTYVSWALIPFTEMIFAMTKLHRSRSRSVALFLRAIGIYSCAVLLPTVATSAPLCRESN